MSIEVFRWLCRMGIFGLLLLSSCASLKPTPETKLPVPVGTPAELHQLHLSQITQIEHFYLQARIGIQSNGKGSSGSTRWRHNATGDEISMLSPIGSTVAKIISNNTGITLTTNDGKVLQATDAETLTERHLGWRLPLEGLPDWALGRPSRGLVEMLEWDKQGLITKMEQHGWEIEYLEYTETGAYRLPKKIHLHSDNLNLKLVIESWSDLRSAKADTPLAEK